MKLMDCFLTLAMIVACIGAYHFFEVVPLQNQLKEANRPVYTVNFSGMIKRARAEAVSDIMAGRQISADDIVARLRRRLKAMLSRLPSNAVVLDQAAVVKGAAVLEPGGPLPLRKGTGND